MNQPFLDTLGTPLLVLHALAAMALLGALTHLVVELARAWRARRVPRKSVRIWSKVAGWSYLATFVLGLLIYPAYRYRVRGLYLDRYVPWASNLFDIKENLLALGLPLALGILALGAKPPQPRGATAGLLLYFTVAVWALVMIGAVSGLVVTSVKGMG